MISTLAEVKNRMAGLLSNLNGFRKVRRREPMSRTDADTGEIKRLFRLLYESFPTALTAYNVQKKGDTPETWILERMAERGEAIATLFTKDAHSEGMSNLFEIITADRGKTHEMESTLIVAFNDLRRVFRQIHQDGLWAKEILTAMERKALEEKENGK